MTAASTKTAHSIKRPPIVVIMGHIDHGKSTLLDYIRKTNVVATEAGGITQHISAYEVIHKGADGTENKITFLDTPGHAAFQGMRARGAHVADIAILVVSAEDGVKEQTMEAHRAIMSAGIPYIVAINKIDKPNANIERTKQTLADKDIYLEGWGGDISWVAISAKNGQGIPDLLDTLVLVAELEDLRGDPDANGEGVVIESHMDTKKGASATIVVTEGTFKKGHYAVAEDAWAPLRVIQNFLGSPVEEATFSSPILVTGWSSVPKVGAAVTMKESKKEAETEARAAGEKCRSIMEETTAEEGTLVLPLVLKADTLGTLEALVGEVKKITHERVCLKVVSSGVGAITENDGKVLLGGKHPGIIIGFRVQPESLAIDLADRNAIHIQTFDIIYKISEWLTEEVARRAPKVETMERTGELRVLKCFSRQKDKQVIGGRVETGKLRTGARVKIMRRDEVVGEGEITELQCQKIKAQEISEGTECGLSVESPTEITERDMIVPFVMVVK